MMIPKLNTLARSLLLASLPLAASLATAADGKSVSQADMAYQAGGSPLGKEAMHQNINPKAPPMTEAEFARAKQIYLASSKSKCNSQ